ncbi:hypothetical protein JR316_0005238 [Psilocybe cubensis]|uniref:N-acetyltransferase domain-containing protein n=2 Tax=Psilocybe cubensis TaxID=181762 RepID=A0A8H7Y1W3_PSICU|nr:hypothetical protein JR316_0005238 [Psilocybe cubensis]KAH9483136.1 hypothetical protein JR316_0005238 [Psilocybe cubensis]
MTNHQLRPLKVNAQTGEPFLQLRDHTNIIITPPSPEDVPVMVPYHNDPRVCDCLGERPLFPYTIEHAKEFFSITKDASDELLKHLDDAREQPEPIILENCPVLAIREVHEDGTDTYIGDIGFMRCMLGELLTTEGVFDWENKKLREEENNKLATGDPRIIWSFGAPSHHGRGIMTDAVRTMLHEWGVPRMRIRHMWVSTFTDNEASVKVVKGKMRGVNALEWKYDA